MNSKLFARTAVAVAITVASAAAGAVDLVGAYESALRSDPAKLAADHAQRAGREKAEQGRALLLPQVALVASAARVRSRSSSDAAAPLDALLSSDGSGTVRELGVHLSQPLYDAKAAAEKRQLQQQSSLADVQHRQASQDLLQRVAEAYFGLLLAGEQLRVVQAEKAAVALQRDRAQARFDVGRGRITDLQEAKARYDAVVTREIAAEASLAQRRAQFSELTGLPATRLAGLRDNFAPVAPEPGRLDVWQAKGEARNTRVVAKQGELTIAGAEIDKYRLVGRPTLELVASHTRKGQSGGLSPTISPDGSRATALGLQFSMPLYTGGGLDARLRESLAKRDQAEQELAVARRDARLQVQDAFLAVQTGVARIGSLRQSVNSAGTALEATMLGRDLGTRTELDVLDAQQRLFTTQLELAQGHTDYLLGRVRLAAAAGDLQPGEIQFLNDWLVP